MSIPFFSPFSERSLIYFNFCFSFRYPTINDSPPKHISLQDSTIFDFMLMSISYTICTLYHMYKLYTVYCTVKKKKLLYITNIIKTNLLYILPETMMRRGRYILKYSIIKFCLTVYWCTRI